MFNSVFIRIFWFLSKCGNWLNDFFLHFIQLLRQCILTRQQPIITGPLGDPPFEAPSIAKAVTNFVFFKYQHLTQIEFHIMTEVAKTFLHCMNYWNFETPSARCQSLTNEDASSYKINYTRWLMFCHVPAFCSSLRHYETTLVFGRTFLKAIFQVCSLVVCTSFSYLYTHIDIRKIKFFSSKI